MISNRFNPEHTIKSLPLSIQSHIKNANNKLNLANSSIQNLTPDEWKTLSQIMQSKRWTILNLSKNIIYNMSNEQIEAMSVALRDSSISHLIIDNTLIGCSNSQIQLLTEKLSGSAIGTVEFGVNDIEFFLLKKELCFALFKAMGVKHLKFTSVFDLSPNLSARIRFVKELIEYLQVEKLTLISCGMEHLPANAFSKLLSSCCGLRELALSGDNFAQLDNNKWDIFHNFLAKTALETLELNANELGKCGSRLGHIIKNTKAKLLELKNNWLFYLTENDITQLIQSIKENADVKILIDKESNSQQGKMLAKAFAEVGDRVLVNDTRGRESVYLTAPLIFNKPPTEEALVSPERKDDVERSPLQFGKPT